MISLCIAGGSKDSGAVVGQSSNADSLVAARSEERRSDEHKEGLDRKRLFLEFQLDGLIAEQNDLAAKLESASEDRRLTVDEFTALVTASAERRVVLRHKIKEKSAELDTLLVLLK